ncbi:MAG: hypothetical protein KGN76_06990 [Acidobacteriota bacterium]|nr:hypothetical protein [Acidobacteriota bacterium]
MRLRLEWLAPLLLAAAACQHAPATAAAQGDPAPAAPQTASAPPAPRPVEVAAGTVLHLRLDTRVGSVVSQVGDPVRASVDRPVRVDGREIIPAGAAVIGRVIDVREAGRVKGRASVDFRFDTLQIGPARYAIHTGTIGREAPATNKKDALSIGIPAAAGSLIGAIAGGGKGALIGGAVGGGAGTAYVLSTRGREVVVPAGTPLRMTLSAPLEVRVPSATS